MNVFYKKCRKARALRCFFAKSGFVKKILISNFYCLIMEIAQKPRGNFVSTETTYALFLTT